VRAQGVATVEQDRGNPQSSLSYSVSSSAPRFGKNKTISEGYFGELTKTTLVAESLKSQSNPQPFGFARNQKMQLSQKHEI
jgi:hypothetical protein